ncbi:MAG: hypothetical protein WC143_08215 [Eubacteriales bacterium]|jgi:hypothetical protein
MLTDEQIAALTDEQKAELLAKLQPKTVEESQNQTEDNTLATTEPEANPELQQQSQAQEQIADEQPVIPDFNEKFSELEKRFESISNTLTEKDKIIDSLSKKVKDLEDRTPTGIYTPQPSAAESQAAKDKEEKMLQQFKNSYRN